FGVHTHLQCRTIEWMFFAEELAKLANLGILDHDGSLLGLRGNHIVNRQARGGGNSNCRWAGILIVADHPTSPRRIKVVRTTEWGDPRRTKQFAAFGFTGHRPLCRAGRPSRDLGFVHSSPLELWLCFRPSVPAVSDLSSSRSRSCFDFKLALFGDF